MTISNESDLERLREIGGIAARVLDAMGRALEPGMTTRELDGIGRKLLDDADAQPAPELDYGFPGATCISVIEEVAHGVPGDFNARAPLATPGQSVAEAQSRSRNDG